MNTYTALFPNPERPPPFDSPKGPIGTMKLIDGIAVAPDDERSIVVGTTKIHRLRFSPSNPPELIRKYVFSCELDEESRTGEITLTRSEKSKPRHHSTGYTPYLLRVNTQCDKVTEKRGFVDTLEGRPRYVRFGKGKTSLVDGRFNSWTDALIVLNLGDAIQIRPAGTEGPLEWVCTYEETGLIISTLDKHLNR
jgi:hypothetical protein